MSNTPSPVPPLKADYCDESHIQAFSNALNSDGFYDHHGVASSPLQTPAGTLSRAPSFHRVRKISALSDFAPINIALKRRKKKDRGTHKRHSDWLFELVRWPLLFFIFIIVFAEISLYVIIRQLVNTKEWFTAWRGEKGVLRKKLRASRTYEEWKEAAANLDSFLHFDEWKKVEEDPYYDYILVAKVRRSLKVLRERNDVRGCVGILETCLRSNFAGVESSRLYSETFLGTKDLIESYLDEQAKALKYIRESPDLSVDEKKRFFKSVNKNMGISALCLSGGASFGYYHVGIVRAFLDAGLLPRVITGTSAGGLIAALACTRTDDELKELLVPELANRITACEEPFKIWAKRAWKTGARFDSVLWARKSTFFTRGSMTFKEAYLRTGRILNISVVPHDRHSPTKLLNYVTAPDTVIWTALLASAAVPGILNPVVLMQKTKDGLIPWSWGSKFKDGSLRVDIPLQHLNLYFNVTNAIVSQVNPHVHLFFFAPRGHPGKPVAHRKGKGWRGNFVLSAAEQFLKLELTKNFKVIRDLELLPQLLGQDWSSVFLQRFDGAITIWPRTRLWDWFRLLADPDPHELERMIKAGQLVTWPKLRMIENRARIEREIYAGRKAVRRALHAKSERNEVHNNGATSTAPGPTGSDAPLSIDSDAENAFAAGNLWNFRRAGAGPSSRDPLRIPLMRRKWDQLRHTGREDDNSDGESRNPQTSPKSTGSFLSRIRAKSFTGISGQEGIDRDPSIDEQGWSSDSSFGDDFSFVGRRPSIAGEVDVPESAVT